MLHAFSKKKSKAYKRYIGIRELEEPRISSEDEITSMVFGPMDFLTAADNWLFWKALLDCPASKSVSGMLPSDFFNDEFAPTVCQLEFWQMKDRIEPDLLIKFIDATDQRRNLLIELKWNARLSGADQLEKQWREFQKGAHETTLHVFIAKNLNEIMGQNKLWMTNGGTTDEACRLRGVRWHTLRQEVGKLHKSNLGTGEFKRWAGLVENFLDLIDIRPFVGFFNTIHKANALSPSLVDVVRFWHGFPGFKNSHFSNHVPAEYANFWNESTR